MIIWWQTCYIYAPASLEFTYMQLKRLMNWLYKVNIIYIISSIAPIDFANVSCLHRILTHGTEKKHLPEGTHRQNWKDTLLNTTVEDYETCRHCELFTVYYISSICGFAILMFVEELFRIKQDTLFITVLDTYENKRVHEIQHSER